MKPLPLTFQNQIILVQDDISKAKVDAIVNAANASLLPGGGVDYAIHQAAGPQLVKEVRLHYRCDPGNGVVTKAFRLEAKYVFHAVGPIFDDYLDESDAMDVFVQTYASIFQFVETYQIQSVAIPNISTGVYRFPKPLAAKLAIQVTQKFLNQSNRRIKVYFYCFDQENYDLYNAILKATNL